ncbi:cadherin-23 [Elysia marginata]|uniref:Cadherin-23 n=1 Tax=Elysia marginata TaxID=1093978 RepID=A0AAV4JXR3_9GAST|nr:cadherin-23 [Elysia marginata]
MGRETFPFLAIFSVLVAIASGNSPPSWVEPTIDVFVSGFSEDTPVGSELGYVVCDDPDGDIVRYRLTSGNAVRVRSNGLVTLAVPLDFEKTDNIAYDITFECVDVTSTGRPINSWVPIRTVISPLDANDNAPEFSVSSKDGYSFFISEDSPVSTQLTPPILISDVDRGDNAILDQLYIICNSPNPIDLANLTDTSRATCEKFDISYQQDDEGEYTAFLRVISPLNYEERLVYSSSLIAIDGLRNAGRKLTTSVNIQINVRDAQDRPPIFINVGASATVNEAAPVGTTISGFGITASDGDFGDLRPVNLSIIKDELNAFDLTPTVLVVPDDGIYESKLVLKNQLDREAITTAYEFVVKVTELDKVTGAATDATATATYSVFVTDTNDNAPTFSQPFYNVSVIESLSDQATQIAGFRIVCNDPDEPSNARYRVSVVRQSYPIYSVTPGLTFTGSANMFLQVDDSRYLDYDNPQYRTQQVVLVAREVGTTLRLSSSTTIQLNLRDINDNSPRFTQSSYSIEISESIKQFPYNFLNITATDIDEGENGRVTYKLEGETENLFVIDEDTGAISLQSAVNYESTPQYVFLAYATDNAFVKRQKQVQITVNILNANDERPRFLLPVYQTSVNESQLVFLNPVNITAVDNEDGTGQITYRIASGQTANSAFLLNPTSGVLTLRNRLNFEETPIGNDGKNTGVFELRVEASDNGQPPQTSVVPVYINVIDVNDHSPEVNPRTYIVKLSELAPPGAFVTRVLATDADGGNFGTLFYRVGQGLSDNFVVDPSTGNITVGQNRQFDYGDRDRYELEVIVSDGGAPQLSATATVFIDLLDGNNQPPTFNELLYYIYTDEKTPVGTVVQAITASDVDTDSSLEYSIPQSSIKASNPDGRSLNALSAFDYKNAFGVNNKGGIFVQRALSREEANEISFTLQVKDLKTEEGSATATTLVTIIIRGDVNTNITFDQATTVYMNENSPIGYNAITVIARDPNNNAVNRYNMITAGSSQNFEVKANGRITLVRQIDYENDPQPDHLHRVVVQAISNDGLQSATVTATISIVDVNDNAPSFSSPLYETSVPETYTYPRDVISIFATDPDSRSYGPLDISISGGLDSDDFQIFQEAPQGGLRASRRATVIVAPGKTLDYNRRSVYNLDITVTDNVNEDFSSARLSTTTRLIIKVIDENNNSPVFADASRMLAVPETAQIDQSIATLIATDKDFGDNGEISYSLEAGSETGLGLFSISSVSGTVRVKGNLLGLGGQVFSMQVRARDNGNIPNSATMDLRISVQNTEDDDGNPKWIQPSNGYIVRVPENTQDVLLNLKLQARPRTGTGILYTLSERSDSYDRFTINSVTGDITMKQLDRERKEFYNLLVYAEDTSNSTVLRSGRTIVIQLIDVDDNSPTFTNPDKYSQCEPVIDRPLTLYVRENTPTNTIVYVVSACDPDSGENSEIVYEWFNKTATCEIANSGTLLGLNSDTGDLYIRESIDYEQVKGFGLCVEARQAMRQSRKKRAVNLNSFNVNDAQYNNVAFINVIVVDENDNRPIFPQRELVTVVMAQPESGPVITLAANDTDSPSNSVILYRVTSSVFMDKSGREQASADVFIFRGNSGALYPALPSYQSFSGGRFKLNVVAIDEANPKFTDNVEIVIYVYEEGQSLKLILEEKPSTVIAYSEEMIKALNDVSGDYSFTYLQLSEHRTDDGIEPDKTDVCFLAVNENDKTILNIRQLIDVLDDPKFKSVINTKSYSITDRGQCYPQQSSEKDVRWRNLWWVLVAVAIFIFICCLILIVLVVLLYNKYRRYMETHQTYLAEVSQ